jgi:hypothetical protein
VSPVDGTAVTPELHQLVRFTWVTNNDESPSPVPTFANTTPDRSTPKPATTQIINDEIPAASFIKTHANERSKGSSKPLLPVASSKLAPHLPENPVPRDVPVDPVHTGSANAAPSSPTATQLIQSTPPPLQLICTLHKRTVTLSTGDKAPHTRTPTTGMPSSHNPAVSMPINSIPVDPDPSDVVIDPKPINPSPVTTDNCTSAAHTLVDHTHVTFAYPTHDDYVPTDPNRVCVSPIHNTPAKPVHIDPVAYPSITSAIQRALTSITWTSILLGFIFLFFILGLEVRFWEW